MGKRKDMSTEDDSILESPPGSHKKHKKHKKHKHKKKRDSLGEDSGGELGTSQEEQEPRQPAIKLKIKIGGHTLDLGAKSVSKDTVEESSTSQSGEPGQSSVPWEEDAEPTFTTKKPGDETSDEEREWLDALEAGTLDDAGGVKKEKDPKLLTARQRALLHGAKEDTLLELPSGYKNTELTEEQLQRRQQRAKRRREQAHEKREKDKKQTLERLLKKQEAKAKGKTKGSKKSHLLGVRYVNNQKGITISIPQGLQFPFPPQGPPQPPPKQKCGVAGCPNTKKYSCSKTGVPLCGIECYKKNLSLQLKHKQPLAV